MLTRFLSPKGLVFTVDLSKISDRENPRTVEAPISSSTAQVQEPTLIEWGDGQTSVIDSSTALPLTHEYQTVGVYQVTMRSATGHLPYIRFSAGDGASAGSNPLFNVTLAVVSIDHFDGLIGNEQPKVGVYAARHAKNLTYMDPRFLGLHLWSSINLAIRGGAELYQPVESFCFDFLTNCTSAQGVFYNCVKLYGSIPAGFMDGLSGAGNLDSFFASCANLTGGIPADMFDKCISATSFSNTFAGCYKLTPPPYIFWKEDGSLDTDKFPLLNSATNCYSNCSADMCAQVPEAYGGTMTVS